MREAASSAPGQGAQARRLRALARPAPDAPGARCRRPGQKRGARGPRSSRGRAGPRRGEARPVRGQAQRSPGLPRGRRGGSAEGPRRSARPRSAPARRGLQLVADEGRGGEDRVAPVGEARAEAHGGGLHQRPRQRDVVRILLVARVIREDERNARAAGPGGGPPAPRGRDGARGTMSTPRPTHARGDARRVRHGEGKLGIGGGGHRRIADHAGAIGGGAREARGEHPRLVSARLQTPAQRLHGDGDATTERQIVVGEESDAHAGLPT